MRRNVVVAAVAACLLFVSHCLFAQSAGRKAALVIGNAAYTQVQALKNPANDAADMAEALERLGFVVLYKTDADRRTMRTLIDDFNVQIRAAEVALFYYSGHGVQLDGENYLVPIAAEVAVSSDVPDECVPLSRVIGRMNESGAATNIIILDACRDNPFKAVTRGIERGLAVVAQKPPESIIVYATAENEKAEDGEGRNGTFTAALLANLERKEPFADVLLDVKARVRAATNERQKPAVFENLTHRVYLAGTSAAAGSTPAAAAVAAPPATTTAAPSRSSSPFAPRETGLSVGLGIPFNGSAPGLKGVRNDSVYGQFDYVPAFSKWFGLSLVAGYSLVNYDVVSTASSGSNIYFIPIGAGPFVQYAPFYFLTLRASVIPEIAIKILETPRTYDVPVSTPYPDISFALGATGGISFNFTQAFGFGVDLFYKYYPALALSVAGMRFQLMGHFIAPETR